MVMLIELTLVPDATKLGGHMPYDTTAQLLVTCTVLRGALAFR